MDVSPLLRRHNLRDTLPRRLVLHALRRLRRPASPQDLHASIREQGDAVNLVTVYRVCETLLARGLVHRHPCDGKYTACRMPDEQGHHGMLHCTSCGRIEEFLSKRLCREEDAVAKEHRFSPSRHVSEILGTCRSCSPS